MAFEAKDWFQQYTKRGDQNALFNVARSNEDSTGVQYYAYFNENGSYIIQRVTTSSTLTNKIYGYYARKDSSVFSTDWSNRASLTYAEYHQLFHQS